MIVPETIADRLLVECLGRPQAHEALGWLCDHVGGRTSGAGTGERAEEWAHELFTRWGLDNVRYEAFPVAVWTRGELEATVTAPVGWPLVALAHGNSPSSADVSAGVVDVGHGERGDFERRASDVRGAVALCDEGATPGQRVLHRTEKLKLAVEHGAAGLMILSSASGLLPRTGSCHRGEAPIPSLGISQEDGQRLRRMIRDGATPEVHIRMTNTLTSGTARNVLAELAGRERPDEVVLAGAHLDSWDVAQGATDNGLGSAIVLEMARALAALGEKPRRTVRFALWAAEEVGLHGSKDYAQCHEAALGDHVAVMNFDMTGAPYGYWTPGHREPPPLLRDLSRQVAPLGIRGEFNHVASLHSDHQPFMLAGVPIVGLLAELVEEGRHYYHSVGDTFEKVSLPDLCRAAAVGAHTMWALADAADRPLPHLGPAEVRAMIDTARLYDALVAEGYDGPAMHVEAT